jgi:hypothetical protein
MTAERRTLQLRRRLTMQETRAVGGPVALPLLAAYFGLSLLGWLAATAALIAAAPRLVAGDVGATEPVLAVQLLALGAWLAASGVAYDIPVVLWPGAALLATGFVLVLIERGGLVAQAPRGRMLVASRTGISIAHPHRRSPVLLAV